MRNQKFLLYFKGYSISMKFEFLIENLRHKKYIHTEFQLYIDKMRNLAKQFLSLLKEEIFKNYSVITS